MQAFIGLAEIGVGVATTHGTGGFATPIGMALCAHGADCFYTGMKTFIGGKYHNTATSQLLRSTGVSFATAGYVDLTCFPKNDSTKNRILCKVLTLREIK